MKIIEVVLNECFGSFSLSKEAYNYLGLEWNGYGYAYYDPDIEVRSNPQLIQCVKNLGERASGQSAKLVVRKIYDNPDYYIDNYDGFESIKIQTPYPYLD